MLFRLLVNPQIKKALDKVLNCEIIEVIFFLEKHVYWRACAMNKRFHFVSLIIGNLLTLGAIFIYAMQSQVDVAISTYALVMGFLSTLLLIFFYLWGDEKQQISNRFFK